MATLNYIHNLPQRKTGFLRVGWWVIQEIMRARALGIDWKTRYSELKYSNDIYTIATMFNMYDTVEIQESLNGHIFDKEQVEAGYIYYHFDFEDNSGIDPNPEPDPDKQSIIINPLTLIVM